MRPAASTAERTPGQCGRSHPLLLFPTLKGTLDVFLLLFIPLFCEILLRLAPRGLLCQQRTTVTERNPQTCTLPQWLLTDSLRCAPNKEAVMQAIIPQEDLGLEKEGIRVAGRIRMPKKTAEETTTKCRAIQTTREEEHPLAMTCLHFGPRFQQSRTC